MVMLGRGINFDVGRAATRKREGPNPKHPLLLMWMLAQECISSKANIQVEEDAQAQLMSIGNALLDLIVHDGIRDLVTNTIQVFLNQVEGRMLGNQIQSSLVTSRLHVGRVPSRRNYLWVGPRRKAVRCTRGGLVASPQLPERAAEKEKKKNYPCKTFHGRIDTSLGRGVFRIGARQHHPPRIHAQARGFVEWSPLR
jgi:hypothetical protein